MLTNDGKYQIYRIQHQHEDRSWAYCDFDYFGYPPGMRASDDCWQETGVMGTFDHETAGEGLAALRKRHPGTTFRLVMVQILQITWPVQIDSSGALVLAVETAP